MYQNFKVSRVQVAAFKLGWSLLITRYANLCFCLRFSSSGIVNHNLNYNSTQLPMVESQITDIALNNDGKLLYAACGDKVKIWDLRKYVCHLTVSYSVFFDRKNYLALFTDLQCLVN